MMTMLMIAVALLETSHDGIDLRIESETKAVDPARSVFLRVELKTPHDRTAVMPDLRDRAVGFSLAEDYADEPRRGKDGSTVQTVNWRLLPEPCAKVYKIKPFAVKASPKVFKAQSDEGSCSFVAGPVYFDGPPPREPVTGGMEADPGRDLPPLSWKLAGIVAAALAALAALVAGVWLGVRYLARRVREHRMSPIERAWAELARLLKKGLPGRGRYKDFYVELTMVVRRYVQRKYGVNAPHLTTEEFLRSERLRGALGGRIAGLGGFLESADMVKFAGVDATPEMADEATEAARRYLKSDDAPDAAERG
ncbi:MAG: hypothetical protein J6T01_06470 [Kiritimatiellae bacterium]|nr:hypothetical protein [Kiritimatiellia bacterium]